MTETRDSAENHPLLDVIHRILTGCERRNRLTFFRSWFEAIEGKLRSSAPVSVHLRSILPSA